MNTRDIVIKVGGELLLGPEAPALARDIAALVEEGHRITVVHGGGMQASELQKRLGLTPVMVSGRRVTDGPTLEVMKMIIAGKVNVELCGVLGAAGVRAVGLHGASAGLLLAVRRPPSLITGAGPEPIDLGLVGDVVSINLDLLRHLHAGGYVPVLGCLGATAEGGALNINGDVIANRVAVELKADQLFLLTGAPGVLRNLHDPSTRMPRLTVAEGRAAIESGAIQGGMIPKLEEAFEALAAGVREIHIVGKLQPGDLLRASREPGSLGTVLLH